MPDEPDKIRITFDEVDRVILDQPDAHPPQTQPPPAPGGTRQWGKIGSAPTAIPQSGASAGSHLLMQAWFYLGLAGLGGAFLGWALCEPGFIDDGESAGWGNHIMLPVILTFMCLGFAAAESIVERSAQKALIRGGLALVLGAILGFVFDFIANFLYAIGIGVLTQMGIGYENPAFWLVRALAWMVFGIAGGVVYGIAGQSGKKCVYGILGGILGAGVGGLLFNPINLLTQGAALSRVIGFALFGASTGVAMGFVESALKDRWLYVSAGPLAGKQFILYKSQTVFGSQQSADIYLFKDPSIFAQHAAIELRGAQAILNAMGPAFVSGQPVQQRVLHSGDLIQIGRYSFQFQEKTKQA